MVYQNKTSQPCDESLKVTEGSDSQDTAQLNVMHVCPENKPDKEFLDHVSADHCIKAMELAVKASRNFFVACGQASANMILARPGSSEYGVGTGSS